MVAQSFGVPPDQYGSAPGRIAGMATDCGLHVKRGGSGPRTLLLLHGMACSAAVWDGLVPLLSDAWTWIAPDLPGHGRSAPAAGYTFESMVAAAAPLLDGTEEATVLGHSLGGALALKLAADHPGLAITEVVATSMKVRWSAEELEAAASIAAKPARVFADRAEAVDRALKLAGLVGLVDPDGSIAASLVTEADGGWRAAFDPAGVGIGEPDVAGPVKVLRERGVRVVLASGENDSMAPAADLAAILPGTATLPGVGHSVQVERPDLMLGLLDQR